MATEALRWRLLLDTGVIIAGITGRWGAAKGVLILTVERDRYTVILTEPVRAELDALFGQPGRGAAHRGPRPTHQRVPRLAGTGSA